MIKTTALVIFIALLALLAFAATRPNSFVVERSISIKATPETIFPLVEDFHQWPVWSPYERLDPAMTRNYSGAERGVGAVYEWSGNSKAGAGRMEIQQAERASKITIKLDFSKPFEGHNIGEFSFKPEGDMTTVTWSMRGPSPFVAKLVGVFLSLDTLVGKDFEAGLADMKAAVEK